MKALMVAMAAGVALVACGAKAEDKDQDWSVTAELTWASQYVTDGFSVGGDKPALQPMVKLDTPLDGVALKFWASLQQDRSNDAFDEYDYMLVLSRTFGKDHPYAVDVHGYADLWDYPNGEFTQDKNKNDIEARRKYGQKYHAGFSLKELCPVAGSFLVPSYNYYFWTPIDADSFDQGGRHELCLDYGHDLPLFIPGATKQKVSVGGAINYFDGVLGVEPGWSHSVASLGSSAEIAGVTYTAGINYQWSYEDTLDKENECWGTIGAAYTF